jgi:hypothetical protein
LSSLLAFNEALADFNGVRDDALAESADCLRALIAESLPFAPGQKRSLLIAASANQSLVKKTVRPI